jgi:chromosome segregation ATPase
MMLLALLVSLACATSLHAKLDINSRNAKAYLQQIDSHHYGRFFLDVIALQMQTEGGVDQVIEAVDEIIEDLEKAQDEADEKNRTDQEYCDSEISRLEKAIKDAQDSIDFNNDQIDSVLVPRRESLIEKRDQLEADMEANRENRAAAIEQREADHELYLTRDTEHDDSIESCEEALELIKQLKNQPEGSATMMQTRSVNKAMETIAHHFTALHGAKNKYSAMLEMLVQLTQNFADQDTLDEIIRLVEELLADLGVSQEDAAEDESEAQAAHDEYIAALDASYESLQSEHDETSNDIVATDSEISERRDTVERETANRGQFEDDLAAQHSWCDQASFTYLDESDERSSELETTASIRQIFVDLNGDMSDYLRERVDRDFEEAESTVDF